MKHIPQSVWFRKAERNNLKSLIKCLRINVFWYLGYRISASHCGNWQKHKAMSAGVSNEGNLFLREKSKIFPFLKQSKRTFID